MGRRVTRARVEEIIAEARRRIPGVFIRTAFIVGFPGETEAEFEELLEFARETRFERMGAFVYSPEEGTPAAELSGELCEDEKLARFDRLMAVQNEVAAECNSELVGREIPGIIDGASGRDDLALAARTWGDAPEVDGTVFVAGEAEAGRLVTLRITGVEDFDLTGEIAR
jgi:ribosomal protein S12 methylthiotransferase